MATVSSRSVLRGAVRLRCMHDCRGIDGMGEAFRVLVAAGVLQSEPRLCAASERDPSARTWCKLFHPPPDLEFADACQRSDGMDIDLRTGSTQRLPSVDLYTSGFPCQPYSLRRGSTTRMLDEAEALPYFSALLELESGRHVCLVMENVMGLCQRQYWGRSCLHTVEAQLRDAAAGHYFLCTSLGVSPHAFGQHAHRPRVLFRMVRRDRCLLSTEQEFVEALHAADREVAAQCEMAAGLRSFTQWLLDYGCGAGAESAAGPGAATAAAAHCRCESAFPCPRAWAGCPKHICRCGPCRGGAVRSCGWVRHHAARWAALSKAGVAPAKYLRRARTAGLPVETTLLSPRQRNLAELVACDLATRGVDPMASDAVFDLTQTYGRHALRWDGLVPTITTGSKLFVMRWGRCLTNLELFAIMGFPIRLYAPHLNVFSDTQLRRFVGNTMHPAMMGVCVYSMLSVVKALDGDVSSDDGMDNIP